MSESRFYEQRVYTCPICGTNLLWFKRTDQADSMVLYHTNWINSCRLEGKSFYPPVVTMEEIKGEVSVDGKSFTPEWMLDKDSSNKKGSRS